MIVSGAKVVPLGVFGLGASQFEASRVELVGLCGAIPVGERSAIASYLRAGSIVFAIMEHTVDLIGAAFGVPGGSAVLTDGRYFWRRDAAEYVEHYGIAVPAEFIQHGRRDAWSPKRLSAAEVLQIDEYLYEVYFKAAK